MLQPQLVQAKLAINQPGDEYEKEADSVAEQVMRITDPVLQRECDKCDEDGKNVLQTKESRGQISLTQGQDVPPLIHEVLSSSGQPLDKETHAFMGSRFGNDFSKVRVHADSKARESAQAVNSLAYIVGNSLVFAPSKYSPQTSEGRRLNCT
jgi:hypothetical protein